MQSLRLSSVRGRSVRGTPPNCRSEPFLGWTRDHVSGRSNGAAFPGHAHRRHGHRYCVTIFGIVRYCEKTDEDAFETSKIQQCFPLPGGVVGLLRSTTHGADVLCGGEWRPRPRPCRTIAEHWIIVGGDQCANMPRIACPVDIAIAPK